MKAPHDSLMGAYPNNPMSTMRKKTVVKVYVKLYATLTKYVGGSVMHKPLELEMKEGSTLSDLYERLKIPPDEVKTAFVNSKIQPPDYRLSDGDEVGVFPPVGGG